MKKISFVFSALFLSLALFAQEKIDLTTIQKIREEGLQRSKVMDIAFMLTDANGPRLTASPGFNKAANYAKQQLSDWGLENAVIEPWGEFGKGWELKKSYIAMTAPYYKPIIGFPKTWTQGTRKLQNAEVVLIVAKDTTELLTYTGKLKGKIVMVENTTYYNQSFKPDAVRYTDDELKKMAEAQPVAGGGRANNNVNDTAAQRRRQQFMQSQAAQSIAGRAKLMAQNEGAIAFLTTSIRNHDGTVFVSGGGSYKPTDPANFLDIALTYEDYMMLQRLAKAGMSPMVEVDVKTEFQTKDFQGYNVIAEIKGTDPQLKDEVVMLGAHLDSWQSAGGATDNAAGSAVMLEAVRILKALNIQPRRTIRIALWSGEEQGLYGSRGYVRKTFGNPVDNSQTPAHAKLSGYFNIDNGTGKIRGIYLQQNEACRPIFEQWLQPFHDLGAKTVTISNTGGTDHQAFDGVGLPGFQFIQDPIEYNTRTHHSNMDSYDHLIADDLKQIATIVAAFVYNTAQRDEKLPRKK